MLYVRVSQIHLAAGDAFFFGLSVRKNLDAVRNMLGVCPQHDVLWNDLTAREHMQLFAEMKGVPSCEIKEEIDLLLERVQLINVRFCTVGWVACASIFAIACLHLKLTGY